MARSYTRKPIYFIHKLAAGIAIMSFSNRKTYFTGIY